MREWTEKHIRELVRDEAAKGGGGGDGTAAAEALLLRMWLFDVNRGPVRTLSGGTITITPVQATNDGSLLAIGVMLVRVDFENCNWENDYFIGPPLSYFSVSITPNTIDIGSFWEGVIGSLFYGAKGHADFWMNPGTYQTGEVLCDDQPSDAVLVFRTGADSWYDENRNIAQTNREVGGVCSLFGRRVPAGTKKVTVFYHI